MTILPYCPGDEVRYREQGGIVWEVRAGRVVVVTEDGVVRITTDEKLREMQIATRSTA